MNAAPAGPGRRRGTSTPRPSSGAPCRRSSYGRRRHPAAPAGRPPAPQAAHRLGRPLTTVAIALGTIVAAVLLWRDLPESGTRSVVAGAYAVDGFSLFLIVVIAVGVIIAALLTDGYMRREELDGPEAYILYVVSAAGGIIMASAGDLIVLFLGLEILSIAAYVLAGLHRRRLRSGEAALKYFVLGGFSSAFFLYGIALIYGATGSTNMARIADFLAENRLTDEGLLLAGIGLHAGRLRVQGGRRPVPPVDARTSTRARPRRSCPSWPRR